MTPTIPDRIARLPKDRRGYPIPWNVLRADDGTPFFTINDDSRAWRALREQLCPICGERLGRWKWFVGGPRSAFHEHGWYIDLPGHHDCITFALATCPYLSMPKYLGRIDVVHPEKLPTQAQILLDETQTPDRPEAFVIVASDRIEVQSESKILQALPYIRPVRPYLGHEYWRHGEQISIGKALPFLRAVLGDDWTEPEVRE
jgi:hypothetical protein